MRTLLPLLLAGASACSTPTTAPSAATTEPRPTAPAARVNPAAAPPVNPSAAARRAELEAQVELVRELLNGGANLNRKGPEGTTPLHRAAKTAYADDHTLRLIALLVEAHADVNARDGRGATALMEAARGNRTSVAQFLLGRGADASLTDCAGDTALDIARSVDAFGVASVLAPAQ